ncbi:monovalent cation/H(+) antiporter subunit G [Isoalcanivorax beigongshangi]|uniref:Monovalent cation/H(+) antiporter subunit G n=1 Tax=Isoalcanivorax beigongshangi TaxID=3238810 RepID=A0ABV4AE09_9GAMM
MSLSAVPLALAIPVGLLLVLAAVLALSGGMGLVRLSNFYQRIHGPSMIHTLAAGCVLIASMLYFSVQFGRPVLQELLITVMVLMTAPVTTMMLMQAAVSRDRRAKRDLVPPRPGSTEGDICTGEHED